MGLWLSRTASAFVLGLAGGVCVVATARAEPSAESCSVGHCVLTAPTAGSHPRIDHRARLLERPLSVGPWSHDVTLAPSLRLMPPHLLTPRPARPVTGKSVAVATAPLPVRDIGLHTRVVLRDGKELTVNLTPNPAHCAPLVSMRF